MTSEISPTSGDLDISSLCKRHAGLTPALSEVMYESACVCLDRHHGSPVSFAIESGESVSVKSVAFQEPDQRTKRAWANDIDTTEMGAYGMCLAAVEAEQHLVAVKRAETLTGADWYVAPIGSDPEDLEDCFRLEISGVDAGNRSVVKSRLQQKVEQTKGPTSNLPAIASVVGFSERAILIQRVERP